MADFDKAIKTVLEYEGGFVNHPNDPGGATNFGISLRFINACLKKDIERSGVHLKNHPATVDDIKNITKEDAEKIYKYFWWDKYKYYKIQDQDIATKILLTSVHVGPHQAHTILQESINKVINNYPIIVDGIIGKNTINAANFLNPSKLLARCKDFICDFYRALCREDVDLRRYLKGWLNRASD